MKRLKADLVDEHYYKDPAGSLPMQNDMTTTTAKGQRYLPESTPVIPITVKQFQSALSEAAFMTGFERNADIVQMCTYAPLFAHVDGWQWRPDLIWFDNMRECSVC